jgi:putative inorganic carbon (HCO3(-)) transporter
LFGWALAQEDRILLVVLVMIAAIPLVIRWPVLLTFGLYAFLVPFDSVATLSETGGATLTRLVGILTAAVLLAAGVIERRIVRPPLAVLWWTLFFVWAALSAVWAIDPNLVLRRLPTAISLFLLYLVAVSIKPSRKELYWTCLLVVAGGVAAAATGYLFGLEESRLARGTLVMGEQTSNPNTLGAVLILPLALAAGGFAGLRNPVQKLLAVGALSVIGVGIFITQSRGALLALAVTMLFFVYRNKVRWQVVVPLAALLVLVIALPATFFARATRVLTGEDTTGAGRTQIWSVGLAALEHVGIFGAGLSNYTEIYRFSDAYSPGVWVKSSHNSYLGTWVELGIIGLVLMLAALASHFLAARAARRTGLEGVLLSSVEAGCVGTMAIAFFSDSLWGKAFWLPWILLTWATYSARDTEGLRRDPS